MPWTTNYILDTEKINAVISGHTSSPESNADNVNTPKSPDSSIDDQMGVMGKYINWDGPHKCARDDGTGKYICTPCGWSDRKLKRAKDHEAKFEGTLARNAICGGACGLSGW